MTVLCAYVPTPEGEAAFTAALQEARRRSEGVVLLNSPRSGAPVSVDVAADDAVREMTARAQQAGVELEVRRHPRSGDVAEEVLRVAEETDSTVIVIGLRRRSPVGKFLLGSSAQRILLDAGRPVLAVKP